ncbi:MAG TPA: hypothetical protein VFW50_24305 [Streptosporangiaceae bacterium]|nr:hypothetical protein [Streptosporangiaceae bacterium]
MPAPYARDERVRVCGLPSGHPGSSVLGARPRYLKAELMAQASDLLAAETAERVCLASGGVT